MRRRLLSGQALALLGALLAVPIPLLMPLLVDEVLLAQPGRLTDMAQLLLPAGWFGPVALVVLVTAITISLRLLSLLVGVATTRLFVGVSKTLTLHVRERLLDKLGRVSMQAYETLGPGQVTARLLTDVETLDKFLGETIAKVLIAVLTMVGVSMVLLWMHWQLALVILLLNPFVIGLTMMLGKRVKAWKLRENRAFEVLTQAVSDTLEAMVQLRTSNADGRFLARAGEAAREVRSAAVASGWKGDALSRLSFTVFLFGFELFRAIAILTVLFSDLTIGQMIAVFGYLWFMMGPVQELLGVQVSYYGARAALGRLNALLALPEEPRVPESVGVQLTAGAGLSVTFEQVRFAYAEDAPPVLDGLDLHIAAGEKVALVGVSGAGKSTLVQLLVGLYAPQCGRVLLGGEPLERLGLSEVRRQVGVVLQQPVLLNDSLRANLTLGQAQSDAALWQALDVAQLRELVESWPAGLDTPVGRNGVRLSGGQRQRLAIARMLLANPSVVVLDEATSMLDTVTEAKLHAALNDFLRDRTTLIIAHRLSAIRQADRVLVFDGGQLAEEGSHDTLVAKNDGLYRKLYAGHVH